MDTFTQAIAFTKETKVLPEFRWVFRVPNFFIFMLCSWVAGEIVH